MFAQLIVWQDVNQDGFSQNGEMFSLSDLGITSISLGAEIVEQVIGDSFVSHESVFTYADGREYAIVDAHFNVQEGSDVNTGATISGTDGNDVIYGTDGADIFLFGAGAQGSDTIIGFDAADGDRIDVSGLLDGTIRFKMP